ncbi:MAG: response regulator transcription factor [Wujia sp.]
MGEINILLLEDDDALAMGIEFSLRQEGYQVKRLASYRAAVEFIDSLDYESDKCLGLFDVMLPDGNGFDFFNYCRNKGLSFPVIFLTAVSDEVNVVQGLELGADDYITKPFRVKELMARIKAVSRRYKPKDNENRLICLKDIYIDEMSARVSRRQSDEGYVGIDLTSVEYKLLLLLVHNAGVVMSRQIILERMFDSAGNYVDDNTLSVYIRRLRDKLGDTDRDNPYIRTVHGIGYTVDKENVKKTGK